MNSYGGLTPPVDQPGLVALLKSKVVVTKKDEATAVAADQDGEGPEGRKKKLRKVKFLE